jgi:hypothetical protein
MNQHTLSATSAAKSSRSLRDTPSFTSALLVLAITATVAACATTPPPTEQIAVSTAAVSHAAAAGSATGAPAELSMARDKLRRANVAMATADYDTALRLAQQAQVDALVAEATTEAGKARKSAQEVQDASRALREEMSRKTP